MFNLGFSEILMLSIIALIVIGPKQLPQVARSLGRLLNEFKRATGDLSSTFTDVKKSSQGIMDDAQKELGSLKDDMKVDHLMKMVDDIKEDMPENLLDDSNPNKETFHGDDQLAHGHEHDDNHEDEDDDHHDDSQADNHDDNHVDHNGDYGDDYDQEEQSHDDLGEHPPEPDEYAHLDSASDSANKSSTDNTSDNTDDDSNNKKKS